MAANIASITSVGTHKSTSSYTIVQGGTSYADQIISFSNVTKDPSVFVVIRYPNDSDYKQVYYVYVNGEFIFSKSEYPDETSKTYYSSNNTLRIKHEYRPYLSDGAPFILHYY